MKCRLLFNIYMMIVCSCVFFQCDIINPSESIPARIKLNEPGFEILSSQGTSHHKLTEFWTYADGSFIGAFAPPVDIYHITDKPSTTFTFRPGIRNNGIQEDAIIYPMYTSFESVVNTGPGDTSSVTPLISYKPEVVFSLISDFETQNDWVENRDTVSGSSVVQTSVDAFEGQFSGEIILTPEAPFIEVTHPVSMADLPVDGTSAYLELHYKTEIPFEIGILGVTLNNQQFPKYFYLVKPNEEWNKIYLELTPYLVESQLPGYKILFGARFPPGATNPSYKILLDNIQVLHL